MFFSRSFLFLSFLVVTLFSTPSYSIEAIPILQNARIKLALVEDHSLPMVAISIALPDRGYAYDPEDKQGLAKITASMLMEGAGPYDAKAFKQLLEKHAITLTYSADRENFYIHIRCLSKDLKLAFTLLEHSLARTHLDNKNLNYIKDNMQFALLKYLEIPGYIAKKNWKKLVFGVHPYSRMSLGTKATISQITTDDVKAFITDRVLTTSLIAGAVGDITSEELQTYVKDYLSPIFLQEPYVSASLPEFPAIQADMLTIKQDLPQSVAFFGLPAISRYHDDFISLYIINHIFGGSGFESYLVRSLREEQGLTYSVSSALDSTEHFGFVKGTVATKSQDIMLSVEEIKKTIARIHSGDISQKTLDDTKKYLVGSFPLQFDDSSSIADFLVYIQHHNLGLDYFDRRNDLIRAATLDDIKSAAKTYFILKNFSAVIVGNI